MRSLMILLAGLCASTTTSLAVWAAISLEPTARQPPYCELLKDSLIRTNLPEAVVNSSLESVLREIATPNADPGVVSHRLEADVWFSQPDLGGYIQHRTTRRCYCQAGVEGAPLSIEVICDADTGTLVFVRHESPEIVQRTATHLAHMLRGVAARG